MLPHHPASIQQQPLTSAVSFPDGPSHQHQQRQQQQQQQQAVAPPVSHHHARPGPASGALSDLLGLENELTNIQVFAFQKCKQTANLRLSFFPKV